MDVAGLVESRSPEWALFEHRVRAEQIVRVIVRYGLADAMVSSSHPLLRDLVGATRPDPALLRLTRAERLRNGLVDLGPTFIKIGQVLSTRPDLVGVEAADTLASLQDDVPADPVDEIERAVADQLGQPVSTAFRTFDATPFASASIAQVCRARTHRGRRVVVKVRHTGIVDQVAQDLAILRALAQLVERHLPATRVLQPVRVTAELSDSLRQELDFGHELRNLKAIAAAFEGHDTFVFPEAFDDLSGEAVLTESELTGTPLAERIHDLGSRADDVIRALADMYFTMIFINGVFHADPHPGNLVLLPGGRLGILDFGKCGRIDDRMREAFSDFLASIFSRDLDEATLALLVVAPGPGDLDLDALTGDLSAWLDRFFPAAAEGATAERTDLGGAVSALLGMVNRYHLRLPADVALMLLVVVQLQGLLEESGSTLSLTGLLQPYAVQVQRARLSPARLLQRATRTARRWERLAEALPEDLTRLLEASARGELKVGHQLEGVDRPVNRLAYALVAAAALNGATHLWARRTPPTVGPVSLPGLAGTAVSAFLAVEVVRAVRRSGGL